ncbi:MAG: chitosanase [Deltaproteobacteria bacterium]|nr:chitosanase [Deltaproteobacteria bacterium]
MAMKAASSTAGVSIDQSKSMENAYRTLMASSRQKTFERVLNQVRDAGQDHSNAETNSMQGEIGELQSLQSGERSLIGLDNNSAGGRQTPFPSADSSNTLATSALLRLSALSSRRGSLGQYCLSSAEAGAGEKGKTPRKTPRRTEGQGSRQYSGEIGTLSSRFESGPAGVDAIGYDTNGGTSYGIYQISSRAGTMKSFIEFLQERSPQWAQRLLSAGPANTGGVTGGMPSEWKRIAAEDPEGFSRVQHDFIEETHFTPALKEIRERTGVDVTQHSRVLSEVLWSTAVQHGPAGAARIFCKAIDRGRYDGSSVTASELIGDVYATRARQFGSSTPAVRSAVQGRFREEKALALAMLSRDGTSSSVDV